MFSIWDHLSKVALPLLLTDLGLVLKLSEPVDSLREDPQYLIKFYIYARARSLSLYDHDYLAHRYITDKTIYIYVCMYCIVV